MSISPDLCESLILDSAEANRCFRFAQDKVNLCKLEIAAIEKSSRVLRRSDEILKSLRLKHERLVEDVLTIAVQMSRLYMSSSKKEYGDHRISAKRKLDDVTRKS